MAGISSHIRGTVSSGSLRGLPTAKYPYPFSYLYRALQDPFSVHSIVRVPSTVRLNLKFQRVAADKSTTNRNVVPRRSVRSSFLRALDYPRPMKFIGDRDLEPIA